MVRMSGNVCGVVKYTKACIEGTAGVENNEEQYCYLQSNHSREVSGKILSIVLCRPGVVGIKEAFKKTM
jgi:hypothetical protein